MCVVAHRLALPAKCESLRACLNLGLRKKFEGCWIIYALVTIRSPFDRRQAKTEPGDAKHMREWSCRLCVRVLRGLLFRAVSQFLYCARSSSWIVMSCLVKASSMPRVSAYRFPVARSCWASVSSLASLAGPCGPSSRRALVRWSLFSSLLFFPPSHSSHPQLKTLCIEGCVGGACGRRYAGRRRPCCRRLHGSCLVTRQEEARTLRPCSESSSSSFRSRATSPSHFRKRWAAP